MGRTFRQGRYFAFADRTIGSDNSCSADVNVDVS
jgi:hypothetical protein